MAVIIIGGGAAGMMAALTARRQGARVILLEHQNRLGIKLSITGKGRCNLTNMKPIDEFLSNIPGNYRFLYSCLTQFSVQDLMQFFIDLGCALKVERGDRVFPEHDSAKELVHSLRLALTTEGVLVRTGITIEKLLKNEKRVVGVVLNTQETIMGSVVLCTGGITYPLTGSDGSGYRLAQECGHSLITPRPSLVGLKTKESWVTSLTGLSLRNVALSWGEGKKRRSEFGEMLFTHTGISGPIVLTLSRDIIKRLEEENSFDPIPVFIDLKPALDEETLDKRLIRDLEASPGKHLGNAMKSLIPRTLIPVILEICMLKETMACSDVDKIKRREILRVLKHLPLHVTNHAGLGEAVVTQGGISVNEIDPRTMASKKFEGLYLAGEMLDVDAYTGGYNLQIAFSTGYVAGMSAAHFDE